MRIVLSGWKSPAATLDDRTPAYLTQPHQFKEMRNLKCDNGLIVKRGGTVAVGSAPASGKQQGVWIAYRNDGTETPVRYCMVGGTIYYTTASSWSTTGITGWSSSLFPGAAVFQNKIYFCNGASTPQQSSLSSPTTIGSWGTLPTSFIPSWIINYGNRGYAGYDSSTPNRVHMSDFLDWATWQEQNFYTFPDNQNGGAPLTAEGLGKGILLVGADMLGILTGYSELDHEIQAQPRRSALLSRRAVCNMGHGVAYLTAEGPEISDGFSPPRPLDPTRSINWANFNLTDPNDCWMVRSDAYKLRVYYRNRGSQTSADSATVSVGRLMINVASTVYPSRLSRIAAASAPTATSHYLEYDFLNDSWSGPHDGPHSCGTMETMMHGDRQFLWVGHASNGKVLKADQDTYTDDGTPYKCELLTGGMGLDPHKTYRVNRVEVTCSTSSSDGQGIDVEVLFNEQDAKNAARKTAGISRVGPYYGEQSTSDLTAVDRGNYCVLPFVFDDMPHGRCPQIRVTEFSSRPFAIRSIAVDVEEIR